MNNKNLKPNVEKQLQQIVDIVANGIQGQKGDKGEPGKDGTSFFRYVPSGASNDCYVVATGKGITFSKTGQKVKLTVPEGVMLCSLQVSFTGEQMIKPACEIDFGIGTSYSDMYMPIVQACTMNEGAKPYIRSASFNFDTDHKTIQVSGLHSAQPTMIKLIFM